MLRHAARHNGDSAGGITLAKKLGQELPGAMVTIAGGCAANLTAVMARDRVHELSGSASAAGSPARTPCQGGAYRQRRAPPVGKAHRALTAVGWLRAGPRG